MQLHDLFDFSIKRHGIFAISYYFKNLRDFPYNITKIYKNVHMGINAIIGVFLHNTLALGLQRTERNNKHELPSVLGLHPWVVCVLVGSPSLGCIYGGEKGATYPGPSRVAEDRLGHL